MDDQIGLMEKRRFLENRLVVSGMPHVVDLGLVRDVPGHAQRLLDFWVFGIVIGGSMPLDIDGARFRGQVGDYYIIPKGLRHFGLDQTPFDAAFFHFVLPSDGAPEARANRTELAMHGELPRELEYEKLYQFLERHYRRGTLSTEQLGVQLLAVMEQISAIQRHDKGITGASSHGLAGSILDLLRASFREHLTNKEISQRLGYSYPHLERVFRANFGSSIHQELLKIRIDAAAHGLQMGKPIKEVASEVGFNDYYYFLKTFKRLREMTPAGFRKSFQTRIAESGTVAAERLREAQRDQDEHLGPA
jgi:AraC-like DNA-binding protein